MSRNPSSRIGMLVSGPGLIGKRHCELIRERDDCNLKALVAPSSSRNIEVANDFGVPLFPDMESAIESQHIDAAIISSPNAYHYEQALVCIANGIPALVEKPLTDQLESARKLTLQAETSGVPVLVGHHRMHSPLISAARDFMRSNEFGDFVALTGSALFYKPHDYFVQGPWRTKKGGGPLLINLIHEVGLMRYFAGEIEQVVAISSKKTRNFEVEDTVSISLKFASGALGTFMLSDTAASSKSWEMTSGENAAYPHYGDEYCYHFAGTMGSLDFPTLQARRYSQPGLGSWNVPFHMYKLDLVRADPLQRQLQNLVDVVMGFAQPVVTCQDGYRNMLVIDAISRSLEHGAVETVSVA